MSTMTSTLTCLPRFGTPRSPERPTLGPAVGEVARRLGKPLMPWQQHVADVSLELWPGTDQLVYDEIGLTVPRQSGKTTFKLAKATHRCSATKFFGPRQHLVYTAQTRNDARTKFVEDFAPDLEASATFRSRIKSHWGNGNEHIRFTNGSRFGIQANTEKSGHGGTLDEAYIDEAFAHQDDRLEQAFGPAMITRRNKQLWVVSTAGWLDASPYLLEKVRVGREQVEMGMREGTAYFEWSAPEGVDPEDESQWWECMPALGITVTVEAIRSELRKAQAKGNLNGFRRAYLNQWVVRDAADEAVISAESWNALVDSEDQRPSPVALSVVVSEDRKWSNIGLAGLRSDHRSHLQVIDARRGTTWVADRVAELVEKWSPTWVAVNPTSPAGSLLTALEDRNVPILKVNGTESAQACGLFVDSVEEASVAHAGQPQVAVAIGAADKRKNGDTWTWKPRDGTDISPLWALTLALHALGKPPKSKTKQPGRYW